MVELPRLFTLLCVHCMSLAQSATEVLLKFGMGVVIDASTDGMKVSNERGGLGGNPAEEAHNLMNGTVSCDRFVANYSLSGVTLALNAVFAHAEDPHVRFAKSLGFYEDADWTLNRSSMSVRNCSLFVLRLLSFADMRCIVSFLFPSICRARTT